MKQKHHILIVDDDADDRDIIGDAFRTAAPSYEFTCIENGDRLLAFLQENQANGLPSLILLDLNMPGKDGRETLREIKTDTNFRHIPTIVFTTSSSTRDKAMAYDLGANCFVTKPDTFNKLVDMVQSINRLWLH